MGFDEKSLINLIKSKKELEGIDDSVVLSSLNNLIRKRNLVLNDLKKKEIKLVIKSVRAELRNFVGQFQKSTRKKGKLLDSGDFDALLKVHSSTNERLEFYPELKKRVSGLGAKSILDLGCGINPVALASLGSRYLASDINESDLEAVRRYFRKERINGEVFVYDLRNFNDDLPEVDLCILFKVLDTIETKGHRIAEKIIVGLKCKYILISFATRKLSGRMMNNPKRIWLEKMLDRLNLEYKIINSENEIFYLVKKY